MNRSGVASSNGNHVVMIPTFEHVEARVSKTGDQTAVAFGSEHENSGETRVSIRTALCQSPIPFRFQLAAKLDI